MRPLCPLELPLTGPAVIEASAGTGKTHTITTLVLRLLLEQELELGQILVVTYTRAATAELRERIRMRILDAERLARGERSESAELLTLVERARERLGSEALRARLSRALGSLDEAPIHTIHAFCQRLLGDQAFETSSPFAFELLADASPWIHEIACDYYARELSVSGEERLSAVASLGPDALERLFVRGSSAQAVLPLAAPGGAAAAPGGGGRFQEQARTCLALWEPDAAELERRLTPVHKPWIRGWCAKLPSLLQKGPGVTIKNRACFAAFTVEGIEKRGKGAVAHHPLFDAVAELIAMDDALDRARREERIAFQRGFLEYARRELSRRTQRSAVQTFDGLLRAVAERLESAEADALIQAARRQLRAALIDEFQDTDPLQYRIFARLFGPEVPLLMIGDPKQAIYGFRGADVHAYLKARDEVPGRVFTLATNHRSDAALVEAMNGLYASATRPFATPGIDYQPVSAARPTRLHARDGRAPIDLVFAQVGSNKDSVTRAITGAVAADVQALLESGAERDDERLGRRRALSPGDVAVLCRTNREAQQMHAAFAQQGLPAVLTGDASVFETDDANELERLLLAMAEPADPRAQRALLASIYVGASASDIDAQGDDAPPDRPALARMPPRARELRAPHEALYEAQRLWDRDGLVPAVAELVRRFDIERTLLTRTDGMRRLTNLWHLIELLAEMAHREHLGPFGVIRALRALRRDRALRGELSGEAHELRLESSEDAVLVTTIHKSKGLEFPLVYLPFSYDGTLLHRAEEQAVLFHDPARDGALTLDLGSADLAAHQALATDEALAEALRLLYVALTRAKHRVTVVVPPPDTSKHARSALAYLLHGGGSREEVAARLEGADGARLLEVLGERAAALPGHLSVRGWSAERGSAAHPAAVPREPLAALKARRVIEASSRTGSFSSLVSSVERRSVRDHDHDVQAGAPTPIADLPFARLPRGARAGELVHEVLENLGFAADRSAIEAACRARLGAHGFAPELAEPLSHDFHALLRTPIDDGLRLCDVPAHKRLNELEFTLPVPFPLDPRGLSRAFARHDAPPYAPAYPARLATLGFAQLSGYLRGFVDLVFEHEGRFFVVDYKSNDLGPSLARYAPDELARAMAAHHYILQSHLYLLALHRYLRLRLPGYAYETHMGGVRYLFLRGMTPDNDGESGVFRDRPSAALVEALDALLSSGHSAAPLEPPR